MNIGELVIIKNKDMFVKGYVRRIYINQYGQKEIDVYTIDGTERKFIGYIQVFSLTDEIIIEKEGQQEELYLFLKNLTEENLMSLINQSLDNRNEKEFLLLTEKLKEFKQKSIV